VIGSSTERANIELVLQVTGLDRYIQSIVSAEDVGRGKPDLEVFLKAAQKMGVEPKKAVVFEDASVGLQAARRGGMKCIAVTTGHGRFRLEPLADLVVDRLDELSLEKVSILSKAS
jgi:beta-phosphoglucomutase-like phosphatase (HAD superfamily)